MTRRKTETPDERRRKKARAARAGDGDALEALARDEARTTGRPPLVRLRIEDYAALLERGGELAAVVHEAIDSGLRCSRERHVERLAGSERPAREALALATLTLTTASSEQAAAVATILRMGAGHLPLPEGATLSSPSGLLPERREAWAAVAEAIRIVSVGVDGAWRAEAPWRPVRAGQWESVLATLLVERDWDEIERTARGLERG